MTVTFSTAAPAAHFLNVTNNFLKGKYKGEILTLILTKPKSLKILTFWAFFSIYPDHLEEPSFFLTNPDFPDFPDRVVTLL